MASALVALALSACASSGGPAPGNTTSTAGTITLRDYTENTSMTLISLSELDRIGVPGETAEERRLAFYSTERADASVKVCDDDAIAGLVELFRQEGLDRWTSEGAAPATGAPRDNAVEIAIEGAPRHVVKSDVGDDLLSFIEFMRGFIEVYNLYEGRNNVEGAVTFEKPTFGRSLQGER